MQRHQAAQHGHWINPSGAPQWGAPISEGLYGAFNYTPERDVARAPMRVDGLPYQLEQLTWEFTDMTATGGRMSILLKPPMPIQKASLRC